MSYAGKVWAIRMHIKWPERLLQSQAVSNKALVWFSVIAVLSVVFTFPEPTDIDVQDFQWWVCAVLGQAVFVVVLVAIRALSVRSSSEGATAFRLAMIVIAGCFRAVVLALTVSAFNLDSTFRFDNPMRLLVSVVTCVIWMAALGLLFQNSSDFKMMYQELLRQQVQMAATQTRPSDIPEVLAQWSRLREQILTTADEAHRKLDSVIVPDVQSFQDAATILSSTIDAQVRPMSKELLGTLEINSLKVPHTSSFREVLAQWYVPKWTVLAISGLFVLVASVSRAEINGLLFALEYVAFLATTLWSVSALIARSPRASSVIALTVLVLFPFVFLGISVLIGQVVFDVPADYVGAFVVGIQGSAIMLAAALFTRMNMEQQLRLDHIRLSIDQQVIELLTQREAAARATVELGLFVHHSIQSELTSVAIRLQEAALSGNPEVMLQERAFTKVKLDQLPRQAPWVAPRTGLHHIQEVVDAWTGIAEINLDLPNEPEISGSTWQLIAYIVEEGVTNAVRTGKARKLDVSVRIMDTEIELKIHDDGDLNTVSRDRGTGTLWLDRIAPHRWSLGEDADGTVLTVKFV
ncbi:unannotated protein [freshwater metagenome]|uniref:Unannotated protein n=1 Tax=freshwater metagenome TaxID=449393 RepID=A0A6J6JAA8_9ZZZZ|nr:hypothetical protein [Actinomycetota bacterium]